jgi:hypothetical protein
MLLDASNILKNKIYDKIFYLKNCAKYGLDLKLFQSRIRKRNMIRSKQFRFHNTV